MPEQPHIMAALSQTLNDTIGALIMARARVAELEAQIEAEKAAQAHPTMAEHL